MEVDPPLVDLTSEGLMDSEYQNMDDGGAMLVEDSEDEQENIPPPVVQVDTPHLAPIVQSLIPIKDPAPVAPAVKVVDADAEGKDDMWYIPLIYHCCVLPLDEYSTSCVEPVPGYVEDAREDLLASPHQDDLAGDRLEDEMWAMSRLVPFGHVFGPLLSSFRTKFTRYSKSHCKKTTKTSITG
jgi:hypothetical protein